MVLLSAFISKQYGRLFCLVSLEALYETVPLMLFINLINVNIKIQMLMLINIYIKIQMLMLININV